MKQLMRFSCLGLMMVLLLSAPAAAHNRDGLLNGAVIGAAVGAGIGVAMNYALRDSDLTVVTNSISTTLRAEAFGTSRGPRE